MSDSRVPTAEPNVKLPRLGAKRKALSKRTRFEVFKRDGFRCVYCGATPATSILHVDHVLAVAAGGTNGPENLVTACESCNLGKSDRPLGSHPAPIDIGSLSERKAQLRAFLGFQREVVRVRRESAEMMLEHWDERMEIHAPCMENIIPRVLEEFAIQDVMYAIESTASRVPSDIRTNYKCNGGDTYNRSADAQAKYFCGIIRNWRRGT